MIFELMSNKKLPIDKFIINSSSFQKRGIPLIEEKYINSNYDIRINI